MGHCAGSQISERCAIPRPCMLPATLDLTALGKSLQERRKGEGGEGGRRGVFPGPTVDSLQPTVPILGRMDRVSGYGCREHPNAFQHGSEQAHGEGRRGIRVPKK